MDNLNWLFAELVTQQRVRERLSGEPWPHAQPVARRDERGGMRRALAHMLVRLGLRLDPAAGEGLGALTLSPAHNGRNGR